MFCMLGGSLPRFLFCTCGEAPQKVTPLQPIVVKSNSPGPEGLNGKAASRVPPNSITSAFFHVIESHLAVHIPVSAVPISKTWELAGCLRSLFISFVELQINWPYVARAQTWGTVENPVFTVWIYKFLSPAWCSIVQKLLQAFCQWHWWLLYTSVIPCVISVLWKSWLPKRIVLGTYVPGDAGNISCQEMSPIFRVTTDVIAGPGCWGKESF